MKIIIILCLIVGVIPSLTLARIVWKSRTDIQSLRDATAEARVISPSGVVSTIYVTEPHVQTRILGIPVEIAPLCLPIQRIALWALIAAIIVYLSTSALLLLYRIQIDS